MEALQAMVVAVIVIGCAGYSLWRLTSVRFHLRMVDALGKVVGNSPESWVGKLRAKTLSQIATGGGACGSCAPNTKAAVHSTAAKPAQRN